MTLLTCKTVVKSNGSDGMAPKPYTYNLEYTFSHLHKFDTDRVSYFDANH